ncbi:hypothetical protein LYSHEL_27630 [Lysobacter helvus]|uniref:Uncharacterized protein n=2 Tax=Lysobacteraceae TaxID=32033 RepID=A0ABN6FW94_9GAMM|nr:MULTISPECIES: hypothetical protein [Lysobacter]BCT93736.1 hypothetical protein LYSCAS_27600 [Lysobacter caseinilyticus]BCT96892.1 hypothetical protein LYSHEL_27630 [Lysobacter helvus]
MAAPGERWYQQPVLWLALSILLASVTGCIGLIVFASRLPADPGPVAEDTVLRVPVARETPPPP